GEAADGKDLYWPTGWSIEKYNSDWKLKAYADIVIESAGALPGAPYLRIYNDGEQNMSESIKAEKSFSLPEGDGGVIRTKFKYSTNHGNYGASVSLTDENGKGITIASGWNGEWISDSVMVDSEPQTPSGSGQWRVYVNDLLGTGNSGAYSIGTASSSDDGAWRYFDIVANTSSGTVVTELAGKSISLGSGIYAVAATYGTETNILKGVLPSGMKAFSRFYLQSPGWFQGSEVRLDNVSIEYTPVVYIDNRFTNRAIIKSGGNEVKDASELGSEISIESTLYNKSLSDKDAAVLAVLYRNGYMINAAAGTAEAVPHSASGDESIYKQLDFSLITPAEDIFADMSLSVFTIDSFEKIGARCGTLNIPEKISDAEFTEETTEPSIYESTNTLSYCGTTEPGSVITYAVLREGCELTESMSAEEFCSALYYFGSAVADSDGEYAFDVKFAGSDAEYTLVINDSKEQRSYPLSFKNKLADSIAGSMNDISDITKLRAELDTFLEAIQFSNKVYNSNIDEIRSEDLFYNIFFDEIKKNPVSTTDDVVKNAEMSALIFALGRETEQSGFERILSENIDMVDVSRIWSNDLYSDSILTDDNVKKIIFERFAKSALNNADMLSDMEKFVEGLGDCTVLAVCEKTVGSAAGKRIIELLNSYFAEGNSSFTAAYNSYSDMSSTKQDTAAAAIMGKSHESIEKLVSAFSGAVKTADQSNSGSSSGGSGGSGGGGSVKPSGGSSVGGTIVFNPPAEEKQPELIPPSYEIPQKGEAVEFSDLNEAEWAAEYVQKLSERGIVSGDDYGNFYPNRPILREEFVKMLVKALGLETLYVGSNFSDVPHDAWFYEYVSAAYANGIVNGIDNEYFGAGQNITREDMCTMLCRALEKYGVYMPENESEGFADDAELSSYARSGVYTLKQLGAIDGFSNGKFEPKRNASRAETAKILNIVLEYMDKEKNPADKEESDK
ncbi:MAG: S-layer homology domain-containing protein, partial [Candidatus Ornithomonoglobus sp.]